MRAFFETRLETFLKAAFICGSGAGADNRAMTLLRWCSVALTCALAGLPAWAGPHDDHDRARAAVQAGEVMPLAALLEGLKRSHPGEVLEVELEREDGRWVYEIKLLQPDGQLLKLELDARTAQVLELKRKGTRR